MNTASSIMISLSAAQSASTECASGAGKCTRLLGSLLLGTCITASALELTVENATGPRGGTVAVPLSVDDAADLLAGDVTISYDPFVLTPTGAAVSNLTADFLVADGAASTLLTASFAAEEALDAGGGALVVLYFDISAEAPEEDTELAVVQHRLYGSDYSLIAATTRAGTITVGPPQEHEQDIVLKEGWNFISFRLDPEEGDPTKTLAVRGAPCYDPPVWHWDAAAASYTEVDQLQAGSGYWVYANADCTVADIALVPDTDGPLTVHAGWNAAGPVGASLDIAFPELSAPVRPPAWEWDAEQQKYRCAERLKTGNACWVYLLRDTQLNLPDIR